MNSTLAAAPGPGSGATSKVAYLALLGFFVVEYLRPGHYVPALDVVRINSAVPLTAIALAMFDRAGRPGVAIFEHAITRWMIFFLGLFCVQFLTVDVKLYVYEKLVVVGGYVLIYVVMLRNLTSVSRLRGLFAVLVSVHVAMLALHPAVILEPETRHYLGGTFLADGNDFAWSACIAIPMALFLSQHAKSKSAKWGWLGAMILLVAAVIGTQSRGGSIALGIVVAYMALRSRRRRGGAALVAALVGTLLLFAPSSYFERMGTVSTYNADGSARGRIMVWESAVKMAIDHPLVGVGAGHFSVKFGTEYRPPGVGRRELPWLNAHSIYFVALGEFGFSGLLFVIGVIASCLSMTFRITKQFSRSDELPRAELGELAMAVHCSVIGFAVAGAFLSGLYGPHLFVLCGLSVAVWFLAREARRVPRTAPVTVGQSDGEKKAPRSVLTELTRGRVGSGGSMPNRPR